MKQQFVREWMTPNPVTIEARSTLADARTMMREFRIRRLPVVHEGTLVGILTMGDLHIAELTDALAESGTEFGEMVTQFHFVEDVMTQSPLTVAIDAPLEQAITILIAYKIGGLPVVDDGKLIGIITETDIYRALKQFADLPPDVLKSTR